jgi:CheY-like chemotaxis protein
LLQADPPHVLISDIGMPDEDGYSLLRRVRALPPEKGGDVPAIGLTAYARPEDVRTVTGDELRDIRAAASKIEVHGERLPAPALAMVGR